MMQIPNRDTEPNRCEDHQGGADRPEALDAALLRGDIEHALRPAALLAPVPARAIVTMQMMRLTSS
jgi:hypothetical protein